jgi:hypothetical protein
VSRYPLSLLFVAVAALVATAAAAAKGPAAASLSGPGLHRAIVFTGNGESGGSALGDLTQEAGFFPAVFGQSPDPMLPRRPRGDLGPRYTIVYSVPGPDGTDDTIRQDVYPYAQDGPVTYMAPGQEVFGGQRTRGGWYAASGTLKTRLVESGLPESPPRTAGEGPALGGAWLLVLAALAGAALLLGAAAKIRSWSSTRSTSATSGTNV